MTKALVLYGSSHGHIEKTAHWRARARHKGELVARTATLLFG